MSRLATITLEFESLLSAACRDDASPAELQALERAADDPRSMRLLADYLQLNTDLQWLVRRQANADKCLAMLNSPQHDATAIAPRLAPADVPLVTPTFSPVPPVHATSFGGEMMFSYAAASVILAIMLLGAWSFTITHPSDFLTADNSRRVTPSGGTEKETPEFIFVGKVSGMFNCLWADPSTETVTGAGVTLNRRYALKSGLMEIAYDSGAKVILQGPCDYTVESRCSGFLQVGKLVAKVESQESRVERKAESGKRKAEYSRLSTLNSRLFAIRTPTALVEDLGTEFGVEVKPNKDTDVYVFRGAVEATWQGRPESGSRKERLSAGEAICFSSDAAQPLRTTVKAMNAAPLPSAEAMRAILRHKRQSGLLDPAGLVASAYHRVWDANGRMTAEHDRESAFRMVTDSRFGRGENQEGPRSSFDTFNPQAPSKTDFVGLIYRDRVRIDGVKIFFGHQFGDGGSWRRPPRVFILKNPVDTDDRPPEDDPENWRELPPLSMIYGKAFNPAPDANPGEVFMFELARYPEDDRIGYGWAIGGVKGDGESGYVSVTELRGYGVKTADAKMNAPARK